MKTKKAKKAKKKEITATKKIDAPTVAAMPIAAILLGFFWNDVGGWTPMDESVQIAGGAVVGAVARWLVGWVVQPDDAA